MNSHLVFLCAFIVSVFLSKYGTEIYCCLARRFDMVDRPDTLRKVHKKPIPVGGGIILFLTTILVFAGCLLYAPSLPFPFRRIVPSILMASTILVIVGLVDDRWELSGSIKICSQIVAVSILLIFAKDYSKISLLGAEYDLGHMFYPLGIIWFVGLINAVNFLDGADGVASTAGIFMSLAAAIMALMTGQTTVAVIAIIFAGALLGFLFCNFPPAKVYLGDTGSMLIGLVTGILLLCASMTDNHVIRVAPPLAVALIPIFDLTLSFFRRISSERGLFAADRCHIQHRLLLRFNCERKILAVFAILFALAGAAGCIGIYTGSDWLPIGVFCLLPCGLVLTHLFGWEDTVVLIRHIVNQYRKWRNSPIYRRQGMAFHYQGDRAWHKLWYVLLNSMRRHDCVRIKLDINVPSVHEYYMAKWECGDRNNRDNVVFMNVRIPLMEGAQAIGVLNIWFDPKNISLEISMEIASRLKKLCVDYITEHIHAVEHLDRLDGAVEINPSVSQLGSY